MEFSNMALNVSQITGDNSFKILGCKLSGPQDLFTFNLSNSLGPTYNFGRELYIWHAIFRHCVHWVWNIMQGFISEYTGKILREDIYLNLICCYEAELKGIILVFNTSEQ